MFTVVIHPQEVGHDHDAQGSAVDAGRVPQRSHQQPRAAREAWEHPDELAGSGAGPQGQRDQDGAADADDEQQVEAHAQAAHRRLAEDFQNIVDVAYELKLAVEKNEFILANAQRRRDELKNRMSQPPATINQHQNYRTRAAQDQIEAILKDASDGAKRRRDKRSQREKSAADRAARPKPWAGMHIGQGRKK